MMISKTFYAIYDTKRKLFKGRGNQRGVRWSKEPTQSYDTKSRASAALKAHLKLTSYWKEPNDALEVREIMVSWMD